MKVIKTYSMEVDNAERLSKEPNASSLINKVLRNHYASIEGPKLSLEQIKEKGRLLDIIVKAKQDIRAIDPSFDPEDVI